MFKMFKDSSHWGLSSSGNRSSRHTRKGSNASLSSISTTNSSSHPGNESSGKPVFSRRSSSMTSYLETLLSDVDKAHSSAVYSASASSPTHSHPNQSLPPPIITDTVSDSPPTMDASLDESNFRKNSAIDVDSLLALQNLGVHTYLDNFPSSPESDKSGRISPLAESSRTSSSQTLYTQSPASPQTVSSDGMLRSPYFVTHPYANLHQANYQMSQPQLPNIVAESFASLKVDTNDIASRESTTSPTIVVSQWSPEMSEELTDLKKSAFQQSPVDDVNSEGLAQATATITATLERRKTRRRNRSISERLAPLTPDLIAKQDSTASSQRSQSHPVPHAVSPETLYTSLAVTQDLMTPEMYHFAYHGGEIVSPTSSSYNSVVSHQVQSPTNYSAPVNDLGTPVVEAPSLSREPSQELGQVEQDVVPSIRRGRALRRRRRDSSGSAPGSPQLPSVSLIDDTSSGMTEDIPPYYPSPPQIQVSALESQPHQSMESIPMFSLQKPTNYSPGSSPVPFEVVQIQQQSMFPKRTLSKETDVIRPQSTISSFHSRPTVDQVPVVSPVHQDVDMILSQSKSFPSLKSGNMVLGSISPGVNSDENDLPNLQPPDMSQMRQSVPPSASKVQPKVDSQVIAPPRKSSREKDRRWSWFMDLLGPKKIKKESSVSPTKSEPLKLTESPISSQASSSSSSLQDAEWDPYPRTSSLESFTPSRLSPETEKLVYGLSHQKLAEPGRPLHHQVMIANFMMYILSVHADVTLMRRGPRTRRKKAPRGARKQRQPLVSFGPGLDMQRMNAEPSNGAQPSLSINPSQISGLEQSDNMPGYSNSPGAFLPSELTQNWNQQNQQGDLSSKQDSSDSSDGEEEMEDEEEATSELLEITKNAELLTKENIDPVKNSRSPSPVPKPRSSTSPPASKATERTLKKENRYPFSPQPSPGTHTSLTEKRTSIGMHRRPGRASPPVEGNDPQNGRPRSSRTPPPPPTFPDRRSSYGEVRKGPASPGRSSVSPRNSLVINPSLPYMSYGMKTSPVSLQDDEEDDVPLGMLQKQRR